MGGGYPRYYFRADPLLGFDIIPLAKAKHVIEDGLEYDIFANDLGCFDKNNLEDFVASPTDYAYFAGDSFTWGYAQYENKFATVWENDTGKLAAKCGVTHTGTRHQFEKFKRIMKIIGRLPTVVFVGFFPNDIANDWAFPHSTVIEGFQVDAINIAERSQVLRIPHDELVRKVSTQIKDFEEQQLLDRITSQSIWIRIKVYLIKHSLLTNIVNAVWRKLSPVKAPFGNPTARQSSQGIYEVFYDPAIMTEFSQSPIADPTKQAITAWSDDAKSKNYHLVFLLIPPRSVFNEADLFGQVKEFLRNQKVEFVDLAHIFKEKGWSREELYWEKDEHLNDEGNRRVGHELFLLGY